MTYKKKINDQKETVEITENSIRTDFIDETNNNDSNPSEILAPPIKSRGKGRPKKGDEKNPPKNTVIELTHQQLMEMIPKGQLKSLIPKKPRSEKQIAATQKLVEKTRERARLKKESKILEEESLNKDSESKIRVSIPNTVKKASEPTHNKIKRLVKEAKDSLDSEVSSIKESVKKNTEEVKSTIEKIVKPILARSASKESLNKESLESIPEKPESQKPNTPSVNPLRAMMNRKYGFN